MENNIIESTVQGKAFYKTRLEDIFQKDRIKDILLRCLFGFLMGISDGIPGYSGATTLTIFGFYPKFMHHARMLVGIKKIRTSMRSLLWLFPFGICWIIAALLFAKFVTWFSSEGFDIKTATFTNQPFNGQLLLFIIFAAISLFSLPIFFYFHKEVLFCKTLKEYKKPKNFFLPIIFLFGFAVILCIGLYIHFYLTTTINGHTFKGFLLSNAGYKHFPKDLYGKLAYVSLISGFLLFLPGISSSLIMLLFDMYSYTYTIIHDHPFLNIYPLLLTFACVIIGLVLNIFLVSFLLKKYPKFFYNLSAGIISGAFITILLSASPTLWKNIDTENNIIFIIAVILGVFMLNLYIFLNMYKKSQKKTISFGNYNQVA